MVVVDSSVWIDFLRGTPTPEVRALEGLLNADLAHIVIPDLVLFEVLRGIASTKERRQTRTLLSTQQVVPIVSPGLIDAAASHCQQLRQAGWTVKSSVDALVASYCIEAGSPLLHRDRDFDAYAQHCGLRVWTAAPSVQ